MRLIPLIDFVLQQTTDIKAAHELTAENVDHFHTQSLHNWGRVKKYAKYLKKDLAMSMFEGDTQVFKGGKYHNVQPSTESNYYSLNGKKLFIDSNEKQNCSIGLKVEALVYLGVEIVKKNFI